LLWLIAEGGRNRHHGLRLTRRLLPETLGTWQHLNRAGPGVEEGGSRCVGTLVLGVVIAAAATAIVAAMVAVVVVVVVLLLVGLLWRALLLLLLSEGGRAGPPEEASADGGLGAA
jgi:hypothetical protein